LKISNLLFVIVEASTKDHFSIWTLSAFMYSIKHLWVYA